MKNTHMLCEFLAGLSPEDVSKELLDDIRYKTLDWMGCVVGALDKKSSLAVLEAVQEAGGNPQCSAFGLSEKTSMYQAAFSNGVLGHTLEYDDVNKVAITHPGVIALTAAMAAAEYSKASFKEYAMGVIAGYEVMIRLGGALNPSHYDYWHTTGTCGTFAAAAAAAKVMGFTAQETERALGLAGTMASGLVCVFGTDAKLVNIGNAISNGLKAAVLAKKGYTVPPDVIEREGGYAQAASKEKNLDFMCPQPGDELMITDSYYKLHASCGHTHSALDALQKIMAEHSFQADEVERVEVFAYKKAVELTGKFDCSSELKTKFSMPYCIGAMLVCGEVGLEQFTEKNRTNPEILAFKDKVTVQEDPSYTEDYPILRIERLAVYLKDGRKWEEEVELPEGKPPKEYLEKKFLSLACMTIEEAHAQNIKKAILELTMESSIDRLADQIRGELIGC